MDCKDIQNLKDAYVDRELDLVRQLQFDQHLRACVACTGVLDRRRALQGAVQNAGLRYHLPAELKSAVLTAIRDSAAPEPPAAQAPARRNTSFWTWNSWLGGFGSAVALAAALWTVTPLLQRPSEESRLAQEVTSAHVRALMSGHLMEVESSNKHQVKPWFNGRIDFSPPVADFSDRGFPLAGARVEYLEHHSAAALLYHRALHPIHLFIWPTTTNRFAPMKALARRGYNLVHWSKGGMTYWVISDLNEHELKDFSELAQGAASR